jgi:ABC-type multidrug transport system ATPase subunit
MSIYDYDIITTGIYGPDNGDAYILGNSIKTQINEIRSSIGFCPQHVRFKLSNHKMKIKIIFA